MSEEWGPWIEHDDGRFPRHAREGDVVMGYCAQRGKFGPRVTKGPKARNWKGVIRYRVRKPRGLTMLEEIAKGVREPVDA